MATVTQLSSGSIHTGLSVNLTGVSVEPGDLLTLFMSSYSTLGVSSIGNLGNILMSNNNATKFNTGSFSPPLWADSWYALQTASVASTTITVNFSSSAPAAVIAFRVRPDAGKQLVVRQRRTDFGNTTSTSRSQTTMTPVTSDSILVGAYAVADDTFFTDSDTLNGTWSPVFYKDSTASTDLAVFGQTKIVTGDGQQIYNGTWANGQSELASGYLFNVYEIGFPHWGVFNK